MTTLLEDYQGEIAQINAHDSSALKGRQMGQALFESAVDHIRKGYDKFMPNGYSKSGADEFKKFGADWALGTEAMLKEGMIGINDINMDYLIRHAVPKKYRDAFRNGNTQNNEKLFEEAVDAFTASHMDVLMDRCIQTVMLDQVCNEVQDDLSSCFSELTTQCSDWNHENTQYCEMVPQQPPNPCCWPMSSGLDPAAKFYKFGNRRCHKLPGLCTRDWAFAMHRSLLCQPGVMNQLRSQIEQTSSYWRSQIVRDERIDMTWGLRKKGSSGCHRGLNHSFNWDGKQYKDAYLEPYQNGPYTNSFTHPMFQVSQCSTPDQLTCVLQGIFNKHRDPHTMQLLDCPGDLNIWVSDDCLADLWDEMLGPRIVYRKNCGENCETTTRINKPAKRGFSRNYKYSPHVFDRLVDYYLNDFCMTYVKTDDKGCPVYDSDGNPVTVEVRPLSETIPNECVARATAEYYARNTYLMSKNWPATWSYVLDTFNTEIREYEGRRNRWMYFERGLLWARRYTFQYSHLWRRPHMTIRVRGFDPTKGCPLEDGSYYEIPAYAAFNEAVAA